MRLIDNLEEINIKVADYFDTQCFNSKGSELLITEKEIEIEGKFFLTLGLEISFTHELVDDEDSGEKYREYNIKSITIDIDSVNIYDEYLIDWIEYDLKHTEKKEVIKELKDLITLS